MNMQQNFGKSSPYDWHYIGQKLGEDFVAFSEYVNFKSFGLENNWRGVGWRHLESPFWKYLSLRRT